MRRVIAFAAVLVVLVLAWTNASFLDERLAFSGHMALHLLVVAVAAPVLAFALAGTSFDPSPRLPRLFAPLPASVLELAVVWGWHAPAAREAVALSGAVFALEQAGFLLAGLVLWLAAFGGWRREPMAGGIVALLLTSMHMTLLGALLTLAPRPLYAPWLCLGGSALGPLADQQTGGILMLAVGGAVYLAGGLTLAARLLAEGPLRPEGGTE
ncbi:MAG: cytochrome c oxidase assembly protein [Geminicoccaceae bacterium]|nr:cytochrome c oxidase assembly protein [Geminicoccaceae bacterium]